MLYKTYHLLVVTHGTENWTWRVKDARTEAEEIKLLHSSTYKG
jgi:hypothetical protein